MTRIAAFKAILLDLDGLLVQTEHLGQQSMLEVWEATGSSALTREELGLYLGRPDLEVFGELALRRGLSQAEIAHLHSEYRLRYREKLQSARLHLLPGVAQGLEYLVEKYPLAVVTGSTREQAGVVFSGLGLQLEDFFQCVITTDECCQGKPSPEPYLLAAEQMNVPIHQCLVLEDSEQGILSARSAGASVLHIGQYKPRLSNLADAQISSLDQLDQELLSAIWFRRPLPAEVRSTALSELADLLRSTGVAAGLKRQLCSSNNFWQCFKTATEQTRQAIEPQEILLWNFWVGGERLAPEVAADCMGELLLESLLEAEVLEKNAEDHYCARLRVLIANDILLLKEPPRVIPDGRWISSGTYLDDATFAYLKAVIRHLDNQTGSPQRILEVGLGTGVILFCFLNRYPEAVGVGTDLDGRAVHLARANGTLNVLGRRIDVLTGDLFEVSEHNGGPFDLILFNPAYRIIPSDLPYPDPLARWGTGPDGIDLVRRFLKRLPENLAPGGKAFVGLELPLANGRPSAKEEELRDLVPELDLNFHQTGPLIPYGEIARISAEKCLKGQTSEHFSRLVETYRQLGIDVLQPVLIRASWPENDHSSESDDDDFF